MNNDRVEDVELLRVNRR